jgi:hypothetical protein
MTLATADASLFRATNAASENATENVYGLVHRDGTAQVTPGAEAREALCASIGQHALDQEPDALFSKK